jgi:hypothetical protein
MPCIGDPGDVFGKDVFGKDVFGKDVFGKAVERRNFLHPHCNNIAGSALVIEHHRNTGSSP